MAETHKNVYPHLTIKPNTHPNRWYAVPFLGFFVKCILLIPVFIWSFFLGFAFFFFWFVTPFVILFTGKYWDAAFQFQVGFMNFYTKICLYFAGLTDKYPGFSLKPNDAFTLHVGKPEKLNRWLSFPLLGFVARLILLIPYFIFESVMGHGMYAAVIVSWFTVLFKGKYPESLHEFNSDTTRVSLASSMYILYMTDSYPSFRISMNHKVIKIILIIVGTILMFSSNSGNNNNRQDNYYYNYHQNDRQDASMQYRDW